MTPTLTPIAASADLAAITHRLVGAPRIALDTEFIRERTYFAELALIQIADESGVALVDPLASLSKAEIAAIVDQPGQCKVLHAARQDVEVLLPWTEQPIAPIFDTQVAAGLCGYAPQIGYGELVLKELGVALEKGHARTDWTRRPLSDAQLHYAADDVRYLLRLAAQLEHKLADLGRTEWLAEDLARLADPSLYRVDPNTVWQRFKGIEALPPPEQRRLRALAAWREERAVQRNLPRGWVLSDDAARIIARTVPQSIDDLRRLDVMPQGAVDKLGAAILAALHDLPTDPADDIVQRHDGRPDPLEREQQKRYADAAKSVATALALAPELLATQRDLRRLVRGETTDEVFAGWRLHHLVEPLRAAGAR